MTKPVSITIKTEHGEYTAPTLRRARSLAKAGDEKARAAKEAATQATYTAWERSRSQGFRLLRAKVSKGDCKAFDWHPAGSAFYANMVRHDDMGGRHVSCETEWGVAAPFIHNTEVTGCVSTANGYVLALTLRSHADNKESVVAVSCCVHPGGVSTSVDEVPGVTLADFNEYKE